MSYRSSLALVAVLAPVALAACSEDASTSERRVTLPQRRRIEPPTGTVRPLPPYAITATEVGPYKLGQKIATLLDKLPSGPRIARFEIPDVLHTSVIRAEDDSVIIGSEATTSLASSTTTFVAVLGAEVARTETGVHVGSTRKELEKLGPVVEDPGRALDPRLVVPAAMRNTRMLVERERVVAIVVGEPSPVRETAADPACSRPASTAPLVGACLTSAGELVEVDGDEIILRNAETEKLITSVRVPNLVFAAPLRNVNDGRDELVAIARSDDAQIRTWAIVVFRFEGKRQDRIVDPTPLYQLTSAQTRWIGADLRDIDLYLELTSRPDGIEVGGLLTTRAPQSQKIRDVVVISPVTVTRRTSPPSKSTASDGGVDAGTSSDAQPATGPDSAKL